MSQNVVIAMSGIAKVFVGEIVEQGNHSLHIQISWTFSVPMDMCHIY